MSGIVSQNVGRPSGLVKAVSAGGTWTKLTTLTASTSTDLQFTSSIDSTYPIYVFKFINLHTSAASRFSVNFSTDGGSSYDVAKTTTFVQVYHNETTDSDKSLGYSTGRDAAQITADVEIAVSGDTNNDDSLSGFMYLFNPSSSVFVKQFIVSVSSSNGGYNYHSQSAGYGNTASAIDAVKFDQDSGTLDSGQIKMYGIGDS